MSGACVKLVFVCKVVLEGNSGTVLAGAQDAAVETGMFTKQGVKLKVAAIRKGEGAVMAAMDGVAESVFVDCIRGAWAWSAVASWECQCEGNV